MHLDLETDLMAAIDHVLGIWREAGLPDCDITVRIECDQGSSCLSVIPTGDASIVFPSPETVH